MKRAQRAQQIWSILVLAASNRQTLTYDLIGRACGVPAAAIGDFLRPIQQYCSERGWPALTSLVVGKESGMPGDGFIAEADVPRAQSRTFTHDWLAEQAPSEEELAAAYERAADDR